MFVGFVLSRRGKKLQSLGKGKSYFWGFDDLLFLFISFLKLTWA